MYKVLKFSYFLAFLVIIACGEGKKQQKNTEENTNQSDVTLEQGETADDKVILFFGNSLTAAYGLETEQGFPNLIQKRLDSLGLNYTVINSGLSGETTSGGLNRLDWVLNQEVDIFVLELGANDGLRGIPLDKSRENLQKIIDAVRQKNPETTIILAGMQIPPNMGLEYTSEFRSMFPDLAQENDILLIPFLLEGVAGEPELNLEDGIHPTAEGQKIVAGNVWDILGPVVLEENVTETSMD
ncbi:arylesterase [Maribacter flavus]|uniref:Arylesterase n=2 Tax=Flavobacteriaceae TaxID=49546 RepID=A0ABU7ILI7_9FLAO|nr:MULTISPECIES: arylesterase [Maribacter]MDC6406558.1 arylesterase [Maribacter sp. PR66]MEE1973676.1 arylesterase [Maribacter flavus]